MPVAHCKLDYHKFGNSTLENRASQIANGIYTNPAIFSSPIISQAEFTTVQTDFNNAAADYDIYGAVKKTAFTNARKKIIDILDLVADYVDGVAKGDGSIIILSGFVPTSTVLQSNIPLVKIESFLLRRTSISGEIEVEIPTIVGHGTVNYFCICSEGVPLNTTAISNGQFQLSEASNKIHFDFSKSRKKLFKNLTIATTCYFYVFASNTVSVAPLSDFKSLMAA
jgi:hypothetical protein